MYIPTSLVSVVIINLILYQIWILISQLLLPLVFNAIGWQQVLLLEISQPVSDAWGDGWSQTHILTSFQFVRKGRCSFPSLFPLSPWTYISLRRTSGCMGLQGEAAMLTLGIGGAKYRSIQYTSKGNLKRSLRYQLNWQQNPAGSLCSKSCT